MDDPEVDYEYDEPNLWPRLPAIRELRFLKIHLVPGHKSHYICVYFELLVPYHKSYIEYDPDDDPYDRELDALKLGDFERWMNYLRGPDGARLVDLCYGHGGFLWDGIH
jgi:hypothetical protein